LGERALIANRASADLFLSVHFNSLPNDTKTRGTEIFTFAPQFQRSTNSWSPTERDDTEREAAPVNRYDDWSAAFAHALHRELLSDLKTFDRGKKIMHLGMLRALNCPGALVESGFLSNEDEARKISTAAYRQQIAQALAAGIADYARLLDSARK
jgi:N-acetylmuramoyl-L-alanine amidase